MLYGEGGEAAWGAVVCGAGVGELCGCVTARCVRYELRRGSGKAVRQVCQVCNVWKVVLQFARCVRCSVGLSGAVWGC
jgi:hypothetical protein